MEALVFRYFATAAGSLWAWAAVLAAALSLWRFRAASSKPTHAPPRPNPPARPAHLQPHTAPPPPTRVAARPPTCDDGEGWAPPKGRFTAYYSADEEGGEDDGCHVARWRRPRERAVVARSKDLGWYRYQDMTVLNGSVVRLWDNGNGREWCGGCRGRMGN